MLLRSTDFLLTVIVGFFLTTTSNSFADDETDYSGKWLLTINIPAEPLTGILELEKIDGEWRGFVEGGPAPVKIERSQIEVVVDSRDRQGFRFERLLQGTLKDGSISGTMQSIDVLESAAEFGEDGSPWTAVRYRNQPPKTLIKSAADIAGTWVAVRGVDIRKYTMALTPEAEVWYEGYDARMDEPQKRCVSPGLVAAVTWSFPFEVVASEDRLIMLYEAFNLSRRVFLDQRQAPEYFPNSSMGFSKGRIEEGEFVVVTDLLSASTRDFNGEPISENAQVEERYRLLDGGKRLAVVLTLIDPTNYTRQPVRRRLWSRQDDAVIYPFECDPDSFFRQLYTEGRMEEYIERAPRRP